MQKRFKPEGYISISDIAGRAGAGNERVAGLCDHMLFNAGAALGDAKYGNEEKADIQAGVQSLIAAHDGLTPVLQLLPPNLQLAVLDAFADGLYGASLLAAYCPLPDRAVAKATAGKLNAGKVAAAADGKALMKKVLEAGLWDSPAKAIVSEFEKKHPEIKRKKSTYYDWINDLKSARA